MSSVYEALKLAVTTFVLPPGGPIVLVFAGVLVLPRYPRAGRALATSGAVALWLCSLPIVASLLVSALGGGRAVDMAEARKADAIVILGGGVRTRALEYGGDTLGRLTLERVRYGAHLARATGLPVLVTGGSPRANVRAEAALMKDSLEGEFGVPVRWAEEQARNTRENAGNVARLLAAEGKKVVLLVMHGFDVRRTAGLFEEAGLQVIAAPTQVARSDELELLDFLPSAAALATSHFCLYEFLALVRDAGM